MSDAVRVHSNGHFVFQTRCGKVVVIVVQFYIFVCFNKGAASLNGRLHHLIVEVFLSIFVLGLGSVCLETDNISRIHRAGTYVRSIQINVIGEQNVFHGQRRSVAELDLVFKHEIIIRVGYAVLNSSRIGIVGVVSNFRHEVQRHAGIFGSANDFSVFVHAYHAGGNRTGNRGVVSRRCEETVENAVRLFKSDNQLVFFIIICFLLASRKERKHHDKRKNHSQKSCESEFFHFETSVLKFILKAQRLKFKFYSDDCRLRLYRNCILPQPSLRLSVRTTRHCLSIP